MTLDAGRAPADSLPMLRTLVISALIGTAGAASAEPTLDVGLGLGTLRQPYETDLQRATALDVQLATTWRDNRSVFVELGGVLLAHAYGGETGHNLDVLAAGVRWQPTARWWVKANAGLALLSETSTDPFLKQWRNPSLAPGFGFGAGYFFYDRRDLAIGAALDDEVAITGEGLEHAIGLVVVAQLRWATAPALAAGPLAAAR